jgi:hypothetical protein
VNSRQRARSSPAAPLISLGEDDAADMRSAGTLIHYHGEVLGLVSGTCVRYTEALERREELQPLRTRWLKRFVFAMSLYAIEVAHGRLPAPYDDARAQYFARKRLGGSCWREAIVRWTSGDPLVMRQPSRVGGA